MSPGSCPRDGTLGRWGGKGVKKIKYGHVAYQTDGDDEQNRIQVKFSQLVTLEVRSNGQISLNLDYHVNSKIFIPIFVCVLTNKIL